MNCEILTKKDNFTFLNIDPSIFNLFGTSNLSIEEFTRKLRDDNYDSTVENAIKEISRTGKYEIIVYETNELFAYANSNGESIFLNKDFCEKFDIKDLVKEDIFDYEDETEVKSSIVENIAAIHNEHPIFFGNKGRDFLYQIASTLATITNQYIADGFNNYERLIKKCETKFYNMESLYNLSSNIVG